MDEKKLRLLNDFQKLSEGKSSEDMIPLVLAFMEIAKISKYYLFIGRIFSSFCRSMKRNVIIIFR